MRRIIITFLIAFVLGTAAGAIGTFFYFTSTAEEMAELTKPVDQVDLPIAEIREKLLNGNFREKMTARRQIGKLEPPQRLAVLQALAGDEDKKARLIAASELGKMAEEQDSEDARAVLRRMRDDADEIVRTTATEALRIEAPTVRDPAREAFLAQVEEASSEIRKKLLSPEETQQEAGRTQIAGLEKALQLAVLERLAEDEEQKARLLAVNELGNLRSAEARAQLQKMAESDAEAAVRDAARDALAKSTP